MVVLGIETSCDETSAAVLKNGNLLSSVVSSQYFHSKYGGVVPELASRAHQKIIVQVVGEAINLAGISKGDINAIAVTYGPGLIGSLLVGVSFAKAMAYALKIPIIGVNHIEGHIFSVFLSNESPEPPFISLVISGGHTMLVLVENLLNFKLLGQTRDDAAGEAFDKVAKLLGLGYPGGPIIDKLSREGDPNFVKFPKPIPSKRTSGYEFSFSGLKTAVLYYLKRINFQNLSEDEKKKFIPNICASFQKAVVDGLVEQTFKAAMDFNIKSISVVGGVAANSELRKRMAEKANELGFKLYIPDLTFCTDNAGMIAYAGYVKLKNGIKSDLEISPIPNLKIG
ncbi:O-sialoglycoprotein endopeptidase [Candidatus Thermokryptus mobilis]|uniref:tRNA N6-adenosine threonylcarbamoyltransferase n=1 Tax=Candidatus Thermokryptus mobilis TaxID=1643428 RepID=A0A0S4NBT9_9BACT|nr:tRNA (adenosine(37)-N6)-threonylcarbamoyltransferase complex transferase subunit TsaD [Candidatus Thermokryptus mobilis]CUU08331.1 O-sialoglycoprotein endopeptidase [Candidatus Thermokryptus mobilis]